MKEKITLSRSVSFCYGKVLFRYKLEIFITGELDKDGILIKFSDLHGILNMVVIKKYDNKSLDILTCENLVRAILSDVRREVGFYNLENNKSLRVNKAVLCKGLNNSIILE